jgi:hydroxypyruvate reductase
LIISDVPGDDLSVIASGPTVPDATTQADALAVLRKYGIEASPAVLRQLSDPAAETPKPGDPRFANVVNVLIATPQSSLEAAAKVARQAGFAPLILGNAIEGEARECAIVHAGIALQAAGFGQPAEPPCAIISGGETTVTVRGKGRGGRNAEFLLSLAIALGGRAEISALAADTDGIDGSEDNAGAIIGPDTLERAAAAGVDVVKRLADNDAYAAFAGLGDLIVTGPTRTNVNDFRAILVPALTNDRAAQTRMTASGRNRTMLTRPISRNRISAAPCAIKNSGSDPVGASSLRIGAFRNACAMSTNTLK